MTKTLRIGKEDVSFECNALTPMIYQKEFNRDMYAELTRIGTNFKDGKINFEDPDALENLNFNTFTNMAWACAKSADEQVPPLMDWLREHKEYNVFTHGMEIINLITDSMDTKKK